MTFVAITAVIVVISNEIFKAHLIVITIRANIIVIVVVAIKLIITVYLL